MMRKMKGWRERNRHVGAAVALLCLVCNRVWSFPNHGCLRAGQAPNSFRLGSSNEYDDYREELKSRREKQIESSLVDALFEDCGTVSSSSPLVPIQLVGQTRIPIETGREARRKAVALVLSQQQPPSPRPSDSPTLLVPLNSRGQLKLVSFAAAQRPLSQSVLLGLTPLFVNRDGALFDNLPWSSWSKDPSRRNRDAAGNFVDPKFHFGKRDAYNRFIGKDWQGRSLAMGNLALRLKYMLEKDDGDVGDGNETKYEAKDGKELAVRILQLQQSELRMELADAESQLAVARMNGGEGEEKSVPLVEKVERLQQQIAKADMEMKEISTKTEKEKATLTGQLIALLDRIPDWSTGNGDNAAPYRGAMGYAPMLDSREDIDGSLLPYTSPYDLLKEIIDDQLNAKVIGCVLENASLLKGNTALGGAVVLQRKTPTRTTTVIGETVEYKDYDEDFGNKIVGGETLIVECDPDEALGLALECGVPIKVESDLFERSSVLAKPAKQRPGESKSETGSENIIDFLSMWKPSDPSVTFEIEGERSTATNPSPISIPRTTTSLFDSALEPSNTDSSLFPTDNPIKSLGQFDELSNEGKAKTLLELSNFNGRLPRPRVVRNSKSNPLDKLLLPLIDESVRRQYFIRDAQQKGDTERVEELKASESRYQKAREKAEAADARGDNSDEWQSEAELLASLRTDVTQDEGAYSRFLDKDEWYERDRQKTAKRAKKSSFGTLLDGIE